MLSLYTGVAALGESVVVMIAGLRALGAADTTAALLGAALLLLLLAFLISDFSVRYVANIRRLSYPST